MHTRAMPTRLQAPPTPSINRTADVSAALQGVSKGYGTLTALDDVSRERQNVSLSDNALLRTTRG